MRSIAAESEKNWIWGRSSQAARRARSISRPVMSPACTMRRRVWPPSRTEVELPVGPGVEMCAQRRQLADPLRALAHGDRHRLGVVQTRPGVHGVRHVLLEAVPLREDGGHSPLCIHGVALGAAALGEDRHRSTPCGLESERQASHTAAEHQEVEPLGHGTVL
jgi:hypothetical protein